MKKSFLPLAALAAATPLHADYPIASHRYLADPSPLVTDDRVYIYCSNDDESPLDGGYNIPDVICVSSSDMKNWTDHSSVFRAEEATTWAKKTWAPCAIERNGKFYLYFGNGGANIGVAVADSPAGPFKDVLGEPLITHNTPGVQPARNMWLFDPGVFIDDDGQAYIYFGGNGDDNVRVAKLKEDMVTLDGEVIKMKAPNFFEAAWVWKREGTYYFSYSTTPRAEMRIDYMMGDHPIEGFEYAGIVGKQPPLNNNNNHAAEFEFKGRWFHVYHNRVVSTEAGIPTGFRRNLALEEFTYDAEGKIVEVEYTSDGIEQIGSLDPFAGVEAETFRSQRGIETRRLDEANFCLTDIGDADWVRIVGVDFKAEGDKTFEAVVLPNGTGGRLEVRRDQANGKLLGACEVPAGSAGAEAMTVRCSLGKLGGWQDLCLVFVGGAGALFEVDRWQVGGEQGGTAKADLDGIWVATYEGRRGPQEVRFHLQADQGVVSGKVVTNWGGEDRESEIAEGKVEDGKVSFVQVVNFRDREIRINYAGEMVEDGLSLTRSWGDREGTTAVAKKVKEEGAKAEPTVDGVWKATFEGPRGPQELRFHLAQQDGAVTGKVVTNWNGEDRESEIVEGKVSGGEFSFVQVVNFRDRELRFNFQGTIGEDILELTRSWGDREGATVKATRVEDGNAGGEPVIPAGPDAAAGEDDKPAFDAPAEGFNARREGIPHGKLEMIEYASKTVGTTRMMNVYTPPGYSMEKTYPVLYLLHGIGGDETEWQRFSAVDNLLDNLIADGKAEPMLVVMPNGRAQKNDRAEGDVFAHADSFAVFEQDLLTGVIPAIEARYSVRKEKDGRALAGLSMGGGQTFNFGFGNMDTFSAIGAFSAAPNTTQPPSELIPDPAKAKERLKLIMITCGNQDGLLRISRDVHRYLKANGVPHVYHVDDRGHDPVHWSHSLWYFAQQVFK